MMTDPPGGRFGVLISGRGSNLVALLEAVRDGRLKATPAVVISNVPSAPGLESAKTFGVETRVIDHREAVSREDHDRRVVEVLRNHRVDLVCLAGYMRILSPVMVQEFPGKIMNIHPALLPAFPGLHSPRQALEYGVKVAGCTVHFVDEGVDTGPIVMQGVVEVRDSDTEETLAARILEQEHRIYTEAVKRFFEGRLRIDGRRVVGSGSGETR